LYLVTVILFIVGLDARITNDVPEFTINYISTIYIIYFDIAIKSCPVLRSIRNDIGLFLLGFLINQLEKIHCKYALKLKSKFLETNYMKRPTIKTKGKRLQSKRKKPF
jgi:hypothetical protein